MNERFAERIREAHETIEVLRKVHPANHPDVTQIPEFFELHAAALAHRFVDRPFAADLPP
jgi:hypothetical protein